MLIKLYPDNPDSRQIRKIAAGLREGALVIYPTDTVYAVGCDIFQARAVEQICRMKDQVPSKANLSFICQDLSHISEYARISTPVFKLMKRNTPGPFTFILNGSSSLPKLFKQKKTVGIRVPDNGIVRALVEELGNPLMTASLKLEDDEMEYVTDPELIEERFGHLVDWVIDGGTGGIEPSTVVDCTEDSPRIIRQGIGELID